jgi:hypothetical protein
MLPLRPPPEDVQIPSVVLPSLRSVDVIIWLASRVCLRRMAFANSRRFSMPDWILLYMPRSLPRYSQIRQFRTHWDLLSSSAQSKHTERPGGATIATTSSRKTSSKHQQYCRWYHGPFASSALYSIALYRPGTTSTPSSSQTRTSVRVEA